MIDFEGPRTVWEQVYEILRDRIVSGEYKVGHPIASQVQIVDEFGIARGTAEKIRKKLIGDGYVVAVSGRGTYVRPREDWNPLPEE
jgi:GntR family transcriptional regulator